MWSLTDIIAVALQAAGLLFALAIGLSALRRDRLTIYAWAAGLIVNLPSCVEGGPGLAAGLILFPILFILAAHLARGVRSIVVWLRTRKARVAGGNEVSQ